MNRAYYSDTVERFVLASTAEVLGTLTRNSEYPVENTQVRAWTQQIDVMRRVLAPHRASGVILLEYSIPRLGKRIDVVVVIAAAVFVLEFKVGLSEFSRAALDQVWDYALDLKNFHEPSHNCLIAPILVATEASAPTNEPVVPDADQVIRPLRANESTLASAMANVLDSTRATPIDPAAWELGRYLPTPTIVEAAAARCRSFDFLLRPLASRMERGRN